MQKSKNWAKINAILLVIMFVVAISAYIIKPIPANYSSSEEVETAIADAISNAKAPLDSKILEQDAKMLEITTQIETLQTSLEEANTIVEEQEVVKQESILGYLMDELRLDALYSKLFSDREVSKLIDSEVEFMDSDYESEETFRINDIILAINDDDYNEDVYMNVLKDGIEYKLTFEDELDTSKINDEDRLSFYFLGEEVTIVDWSVNEVTLFKGNEVSLYQGETYTVGEAIVELRIVGDNDEALICVDEDCKEIEEGETKTINDVQIRVENVIFNSVTPILMATLIIGEDVEETILDGDEYEEDSAYEYVIDANSIGLILVEDFNDIDEDEEFKAIAKGDKLCLPNDYVCVRYNGLVDEEFEDYKFYTDEAMLMVKGKFQAGIEDFDRLYINDSKAYSDDDLTEEVTESITLGNSDVELIVTVSNEVSFNDVVIVFNTTELVSLEDNSIDLSSKEENFRTVYGSIIDAPENNFENSVVEISVPREELEASISII